VRQSRIEFSLVNLITEIRNLELNDVAQIRRKAQRAEDEKMMFEMRRKQEEARQKELEERKRKEAEAKRQRLEEAEKKRLAMQQAIKQRDEAAKRNFMDKTTAPGAVESGPIVFGMQDGEFSSPGLALSMFFSISTGHFR
jgi:ATPase subunit of ABC transporter with duplicated ATPase domains